MKSFNLLLFSATISLIFILSCKDEDIISNPNIEINDIIEKENERLKTVIPTKEIKAFLTGIITDESNNPISGVKVSYGSSSVTTDVNGQFTFGEIALNEKYALIKAEKQGYLNNFKTFTPTVNAYNTISLQLLNEGASKTINANNGGTITLDTDIRLTFPANSIANQDGSLFSGSVNVYGRYIDPDVTNFTQIMPGMLAGLTDENNIDALISYGMITVELKDQAGNDLEIASGETVKISLPAKSGAPETVPLWHFNETYGLWIEAGEATKVNERYLAEVNHFSTWNLDVQTPGFDVNIIVIDETLRSIANQRIDVENDENDKITSVYTDNNGAFTLVSATQNLKFTFILSCNSTIEKTVSIGTSGETQTIIVNSSDLAGNSRIYSISGQISDCDADTNAFDYDNRGFYIRAIEDDNIYFGGITDQNGNYQLTNILCDVNTSSTYNLVATVNLENGNVKIDTFQTIFNGNSKIVDFNYCGITETDTIGDDFIIPFEGIFFESNVREVINKPIGVITYADVKDVEEMSLKIVDPTGIETYYFTGIQFFKKLNKLGIQGSMRFERTEFLAQLPNLRTLNTLNCPDLGSDVIGTLINLEHLSLRYPITVQCFAFKNLTKLKTLKISGIVGLNIECFNSLDFPELYDLDLNNNQIRKVSTFEKLIGLSSLNLSNNDISDISPLNSLQDFPFLWEINLGDNHVSSVEALRGLKSIVKLSLSKNLITDITPLCAYGNEWRGDITLSSNGLTREQVAELQNCLPKACVYDAQCSPFSVCDHKGCIWN